MSSGIGDGWVIVRTSGARTLTLAASLAEDGYETWTPVETLMVKARRANKKREALIPLLPSYVFVRARHLLDLLQLTALPSMPRRGAGLSEPAHASFTVMHWGERIPLVADRDLDPIRRIEARRRPVKRAAYSFPRNASTRVKDGIFGGMIGTVIRSSPTKTCIRFGKGYPVEIPTSLLDPATL